MNRSQRVATSAFIYHNGKALIAQRAIDEPFLANHWENVGGSLEWGEHPTDGLKREVMEEAGLQVKIIRPYYVHHYIRADIGVQIIEAAYICYPESDPFVTLSNEHQAYKWISADELKEIQPMTEKMRDLVNKGFQCVEAL